MGLLLGVGFGILAGIFAKWVMPVPNAGGISVAIPIGIAGAIAGGLVGTILPAPTATGFDFRSMLLAISGSLFLLFCHRCYALRGSP